ncbi:hypothetical protein Tco_0259892 [Tanacetum coccineum]
MCGRRPSGECRRAAGTYLASKSGPAGISADCKKEHWSFGGGFILTSVIRAMGAPFLFVQEEVRWISDYSDGFLSKGSWWCTHAAWKDQDSSEGKREKKGKYVRIIGITDRVRVDDDGNFMAGYSITICVQIANQFTSRFLERFTESWEPAQV